MKKFLALALAAVMTMGLMTGCAPKEEPTTAPTAGDTTAAVATEAAGDADEFLVGAIYITSQNDVAGYTYQHHNGITTAMKDLGLDPATQLKIVDNVPEDDTQVANAIDSLAGQGCKIIFGISFGYINAMAEAADKEEYADILFSHATGYLSNETNFNNYFGRIYQARYLSGVAAGMKSLETGNNNMGYVAAWNTEYAETCSGINAFTMGAKAVNPDATVYVNQISSWGDETLERQAAQALVDTYNVGIIAQHSDSAQPQLIAEENGIYGIGYNSDMTAQAPAAHIAAPIWHWNVYYQTAIEAAQTAPESFMENVGIYYGGLNEGFVDLSPISENAAAGTEEVVTAVRDLMESGEWDVFSGVSLEIAADGTITQVEAPVMINDGTEAEAIDDGTIKGMMNYNVEGVVVG